MATIRKRGNSYQIRVSCGYDTSGNQVEHSMTWKPDPKMTEKQIQKPANKNQALKREVYKKLTSIKIGTTKRPHEAV